MVKERKRRVKYVTILVAIVRPFPSEVYVQLFSLTHAYMSRTPLTNETTTKCLNYSYNFLQLFSLLPEKYSCISLCFISCLIIMCFVCKKATLSLWFCCSESGKQSWVLLHYMDLIRSFGWDFSFWTSYFSLLVFASYIPHITSKTEYFLPFVSFSSILRLI